MKEIWNDIKSQYRYGDVSQKIILLNLAIFIFSIPLFYQFRMGFFDYPDFLALRSQSATVLYFPWTLLTYSFFHSGIIHLLFNLIFLYSTGNLFFTFFNTKQFLTTYLLGAIFSGVCYVVLQLLLGYDNLLVGASAAILAVFFTVVFYSPLMIIRLPLIGYVKLWHLAMFILLMDVLYFYLGNTGGHIAHLAGVLYGFINVQLLKKGVDISLWFSVKPKQKKHTFKKVYKNESSSTQTNSSGNPQQENQRRLDEILDKISKSGYDSLSKDEKEFLFKQNEK